MIGRIFRTLLVTSVLLLSFGCSWNSRSVSGPDNIPMAEAGGPLKDVSFGFDSYDLSSEAEVTLQGNADWLAKNSKVLVEIEGHCDERGTAEYNYALGNRRAQAVKDYLRSLGINEARMGTVSYGEDLPLDSGRSEEALSKNRRAHFAVK